MFLMSTLSAQCDFAMCGQSSGAIKDNSVSYYPIHISGVLNNDLSDPGQGVFKVSLDFKHDRISDIEAHLIAPDGQMVQLLGKSNSAGGQNTNLTRWKICFFPESIVVTPDEGHNEYWTNTPMLPVMWELTKTYTGQYKPYDGQLENFNLGDVNGTWLLKIEDVKLNADGNLIDFSIEFYDEEGIDCIDCAPNAGLISVEKDTICEGEFIEDYIIWESEGYVPDSLIYDYDYIVYKDNILIQRGDSIITSLLAPGSYEVCGISYKISDNIDTIFEHKDSLLLALSDGVICGEITTDCKLLLVEAIDGSTVLDIYLCKNETYDYDGVQYESTGVYYIFDEESNCDNLVILNIDKFDLEPNIYSIGSNILSCQQAEVFLAIDINTDPYESYWYTNDGHFNSITNQTDTVKVNKEGIYSYVWSDGNCSDTISYHVLADASFLNVNILYDNIGCDSVKVYFEAENTIEEKSWILPNGLGVNALDTIYSSLDGWYYLSGTYQENCEFQAADWIPTIKIDSLVIEIDSIDCTQDSAIINIVNSAGDFDFIWRDNLNNIIGDSSVLTVKQVGDYFLEVNYEECLQFDTVSIEQSGNFPVLLNYSIDSLTCQIDSVDIITSYDQDDLTYTWTGPAFESEDIIPRVSIPGIYILRVQNSEGCTSIDSFIVYNSVEKIDIFVSDTIISCLQDSVQLIVATEGIDLSYLWSGPDGFSSIEQQPFVFEEGIYTIEVSNDDCSSYKELTVEREVTFLDVDLFFDSLTCDIEFATINSNLIDTLVNELTWNGPDGFTSSESIITNIEKEGIYYLTVIDSMGCLYKDSVMIASDKSQPIVFAGEDTSLNCVSGPLSLDGAHDLDINQAIIQWSSEEGHPIVNSNSLTPTLSEPGIYYLTVESLENGCSTTDTILIDEGGSLNLNIGSDTIVVPGAKILVKAKSNVSWSDLSTINWSSNISLNCNECQEQDILIVEDTWVQLEIIDADGCKAISRIMIKMIDIEDIYIPNVFITDQEDFFFTINYLPHVSKIKDVSIYDRWGDLIRNKRDFISPNEFKWDGMFKGKPAEPGVYVVIVNYELVDGSQKVQIGTTALLK